jgi:hypothetical protein
MVRSTPRARATAWRRSSPVLTVIPVPVKLGGAARPTARQASRPGATPVRWDRKPPGRRRDPADTRPSQHSAGYGRPPWMAQHATSGGSWARTRPGVVSARDLSVAVKTRGVSRHMAPSWAREATVDSLAMASGHRDHARQPARLSRPAGAPCRREGRRSVAAPSSSRFSRALWIGARGARGESTTPHNHRGSTVQYDVPQAGVGKYAAARRRAEERGQAFGGIPSMSRAAAVMSVARSGWK